MPGESVTNTDLITTAYQEVGEYYRNSVEVTKFTWDAFRIRSAAALVAAGYIVVNHPAWDLIAASVLFLAGLMALVTARQMKSNQTVIQSTVAAGIILEFREPGLGFLYRNTIHEKHRASIWEKYGDGKIQMSVADMSELGRIPQTALLCKSYCAVFMMACLIVIVHHLVR